MPNRRSFEYRLCRLNPNISAADARLSPVSFNAASMHSFSITSVVSRTSSFSGTRPTSSVSCSTDRGSSLLDRYFRVSNGNTQVNATELRALPLPPLRAIEAIGKKLTHEPLTGKAADRVVTEVLRVPRHLGVSPEVLAHA